jgi:hypothetical protein
MRIVNPGEVLEAPGILANPVPVEALYDREAAHQVILRNLLQRQGYNSLDEVRSQELQEAVLEVLIARGLEVSDELRAALAETSDTAALRSALRRAATVASAADVLAGLRS